eukprot:2374537-Rhodomonas_salina.5
MARYTTRLSQSRVTHSTIRYLRTVTVHHIAPCPISVLYSTGVGQYRCDASIYLPTRSIIHLSQPAPVVPYRSSVPCTACGHTPAQYCARNRAIPYVSTVQAISPYASSVPRNP